MAENPAAPLVATSVPQRLEVLTVRAEPEGPATLRLMAWTEGFAPAYYFFTPEQALAWAGLLVRQATVAQAWNRPAAGPM